MRVVNSQGAHILPSSFDSVGGIVGVLFLLSMLVVGELVFDGGGGGGLCSHFL